MPTVYPPAVSIIIPVYNRAGLILRTLSSIWSQTYKDYEIIIVDDGSNDNLKEVLTPHWHTIHYIHQANQGVAAARNRGINAARGSWIAFLDSDDIWLPDKLMEQMEWLALAEKSVCFTDIRIIKDTFNLNDYEKPVVNKKGKWIKARPLALVLNKALYVQTMVIKKDLLFSLGNFNIHLPVTEDTELIYRLTNNTDFFLFVKKPLVLIERSPSRRGLSEDDKCNRIYAVFSGAKILFNAYLEYNSLNNNYHDKHTLRLLRRRISYFLSRQAEILCAHKKYAEAKTTALDALYFHLHLATSFKSFLIIIFAPLMRRIYAKKYNC